MTRKRSLGGVLAVGASGGAALLLVHGTGGELPLVCPLHAVTGLWCPFCGAMRATAALSRADLAAALSYNAVAVVILAVAMAYWVRQLVVALQGGRAAFPALPSPVLVALGAVLLVFAVWRNIPTLPLADRLAP